MVPAQVIWADTRQLQANATSLVAIIPIAAVGVLVYYFGGHREVDLRVAALMTVGALAGAYLGARLATALPERTLKLVVAVAFVLAGVKQLVLPGS